jgi:hypothetical protein
MTSQMESVQRHLGRRLTNGLASNNTDRLARLHKGSKVLEIKHLFETLLEDFTFRVLLLVLE